MKPTYFKSEEGSRIFLRNVGIFLKDFTVSRHGRPEPESPYGQSIAERLGPYTGLGSSRLLYCVRNIFEGASSPSADVPDYVITSSP
jgi:hypothetical protein